ncbi:monocarboxylate transporter 12-like [Patiria miniata]|uniref:Major facilitator superfamily (MFS) profile domain-containing protein n=1 Tax=Patiria miniata TaxID=46514 RepID=A0A913ZIT8_PATMI|nr:monocarboxylate transporter 12-like [Patiria miniata]
MEFNRYGCFITLFAFINNLIWGCVVKSMGVLLPTLREQFTTETWIIGTVAALMGATSDVAGLLTLPLENVFGCRRVLIFNSVVGSIGLVLVAFATSTVHFALAFCTLAGPAFGISGVLSKALLARHFTKHYALACGLGYSGQAVALLTFAPLTQLFLDTYGWRGAVLLIGGFSMHHLPSALVVRDAKPQYESLKDSPCDNPDNTDHGRRQGGNESDDGTISIKAFWLRLCKALDLAIFFEFNFWIVLTCRFGITSTFVSWLLYFVPHLQVKGFSPQVAASLCTAAAVGFAFGTVIWSPFIDRGLIKCSTAIIISSLALTFSFVVDPWVNEVIGYVIITFIYGLFASALYTLIDVITKDLINHDRLVSAFGWMRAFFVGRLIAGFLPGWIYDASGTYDMAFILLGLIQTASLIPLIIGILRKTF